MTTTLTNIGLADALDAFWNAALTHAQGHGYDVMQNAACMATGLAAVAEALRTNDSPPADSVPMPQNAEQAAAMVLIGNMWLTGNVTNVADTLGPPVYPDSPYANWYAEGRAKGWIDTEPTITLTPEDLQLLMQLNDVNLPGKVRPVIESSGWEQALRLGDLGYIAIEQMHVGGCLHITRLGRNVLVKALEV